MPHATRLSEAKLKVDVLSSCEPGSSATYTAKGLGPDQPRAKTGHWFASQQLCGDVAWRPLAGKVGGTAAIGKEGRKPSGDRDVLGMLAQPVPLPGETVGWKQIVGVATCDEGECHRRKTRIQRGRDAGLRPLYHANTGIAEAACKKCGVIGGAIINNDYFPDLRGCKHRPQRLKKGSGGIARRNDDGDVSHADRFARLAGLFRLPIIKSTHAFRDNGASATERHA